MSILSKFFGRTASEGAAFALGTAVAPTLVPAVRALENDAWLLHPEVPLEARDAAMAAAMQVADYLNKADEAARNGVNGERFAALVDIARAYPAVGELIQLRRRSIITEAELLTLLNRLGFTDTNAARLAQLQHEVLSAADLAMMRQQGFIDRPEQIRRSALVGVDEGEADLLYEISGLPPGIETAMTMWRRGIIDRDTFAQIVREGHTKTKYTDELEALKRELLNPATVVNLFLRGWIDQADYHSRMLEHGYNAAEADDWYDSAGRPAAPVQMMTAVARGVDGPDGRPMDREQFLKGIRESDIRPEWGPMLWGIRHAYPSLFQLRAAVQSGGITRARALEILRFERYEDSDAVGIVDAWLAGSGTTAKGLTAADVIAEYEGLYITQAEALSELEALGFSAEAAAGKLRAAEARRAKTYRDAAIRAIRKRFNLYRSDEAGATAALEGLAVPAEAITHLLELWTVEREEKARVLTPAQIRKAYAEGIFTRERALAELEALGYSAEDAAILLDE